MSRRILQSCLRKWGYQVIAVDNGLDAWNTLQKQDSPHMAIFDWIMPGMNGTELCRRIRNSGKDDRYRYILLLTARTGKEDVVAGLESGADDYLTKPFDSEELRARVRAGMRILGLQETLIRARTMLAQHIVQRDRLEIELRQAQKLEAVGTLAAGVAHEINTPIQFVGDNLRFLQDAFASLQDSVAAHQKTQAMAADSGGVALHEERGGQGRNDIQYLIDEIPKALSQSVEGVSRVATIVRALREFAHPGSREMVAADLNTALQSTLIVARNELKYVAEVEEVFGELPQVRCSIGDLNQAFLNLLINAAHAIQEVVKESRQKGRIRVESRAEGDWVQVTISDTGCGIPREIQDKIFDPFFTTKEVGRGTGQGLAIARSIIVEKHQGTLTFTSDVGRGTTFVVRLPVNHVGNGEKTPDA